MTLTTQQIIALYLLQTLTSKVWLLKLGNYTIEDISKILDINIGEVNKILSEEFEEVIKVAEMQQEKRSKEETLEAIAKAYQSGVGYDEIQKTFHATGTIIKEALIKYNVALRRPKNEKKTLSLAENIPYQTQTPSALVSRHEKIIIDFKEYIKSFIDNNKYDLIERAIKILKELENIEHDASA